MHEAAIVGAGLISSLHIEAYEALADRVRLAAVVDTDRQKAGGQVERYGLTARVETDLDAILGDPAIDLVSVCVPPAAHATVASALLRAGKHVLLEKPMAPSLAECDEILAAADSGGVQISVVSQKRFADDVMRAKRLADRGAVGRLLFGRADSFWWRGDAYYEVDWRGRWQTEGGGCVFIHAVHHIDLLLWFMGMPATVTAVVSNVSHPSSDVEDLAIATLCYADGRLAQLTVGLVHHGEKQRICFQGERAGLSVPWEVTANSSDRDGFPEQAAEVEAELAAAAASQPFLAHTGHAGQIVDLLDAIDGNRTPICTGRQGREALELITAIYASAADGRTVDLPLTEEHPFYGAGAWQAAMAGHVARNRARA